MSFVSDQNCVSELCRSLAVFRGGRPGVWPDHVLVPTLCDYWLNRKYLAWLHHSSDVRPGMMWQRWSLIEQLADTMSGEVSNHAEAGWLSDGSDSISDGCPSSSRAAKLNGLHQSLV